LQRYLNIFSRNSLLVTRYKLLTAPNFEADHDLAHN